MFDEILFYSTVYVSLFLSIFWFVTHFTSQHEPPRKKGSFPSLSVLVPAFNEERNIGRCIRSLLAQRYPGLKIIVVDDGSNDNTLRVAQRMTKKEKNMTVLTKKNGGKSSALNLGLRRVETELFGFIDADTFLSKGALRNMVRYIDNKTASVIAVIKPDHVENSIEKLQKIEYMVSSFTRKLMTVLNSLYYTPGFALYKTALVKKLGGFDEKNIAEDLEIGLRLKNKGYTIENSLEDYAYTKVPNTFMSLFAQRMRWYRGYIYNSKKYAHLFFNNKFGDLGVLVLPFQYILLGLLVPLFIYGAYSIVSAVVKVLINVSLVGFDAAYFLTTARLDLLTPTTFFFTAIVVAFVLMIKLSEYRVKSTSTIIEYAIYLVVYPFLNMIFWVAAFAYELARKERRWNS